MLLVVALKVCSVMVVCVLDVPVVGTVVSVDMIGIVDEVVKWWRVEWHDSHSRLSCTCDPIYLSLVL